MKTINRRELYSPEKQMCINEALQAAQPYRPSNEINSKLKTTTASNFY